MPNYLVTGRAGSGKSTVAAELSSRGLTAYDTDTIAGLTSWVDVASGAKVHLTDATFIDLSKYVWVWDYDVLRHFLSDKDGVFVCGGADNDFEFEPFFARHFVLDVSPETQIKRLLTRTTNDYGKDPAMHETIIRKEAAHVKLARSRGAILLDAEQAISEVVDVLLRHTK